MAQNPLDFSGSDLVINNIYQGASTPGSAGTLANESSLSGVTPGTVAASKAVIVDSSKNITAFGTVGSGAITVTSASANALAVGLTGATNPAFNIDASTASQVAGLKITGAATGGTVAVVTTDSGGANNLTVNALGTGTIGIGSVSTGRVTITPVATVTGALTTGGGITPVAGTTSVAPLTLTAGTNLTTAAVGAVEFDGTAFYATAVASSRQQLDAEQYTIASADSATYNNTALDTTTASPVFTTTMGGSANGAITLVAGKTYAFEACYNMTNTGTTSHTWATLFGGTATITASSIQAFGISATTANTPSTGGLTGFGTGTDLTFGGSGMVVTAASTSATEQVTILLQGTFVVNAAGTLIPQIKASARPGASGTPGVVVKRGSFFRIWEMSTSATVGNWS